MNISPLLFAVFSGGVVLCQPSLCSSQSWEIKCLQQYCAGVMLNQHAGLASVNPNVSRQRLFLSRDHRDDLRVISVTARWKAGV